MACCWKNTAVRIERTHVAVSSRPAIVRTVRHNVNVKATASSQIKPSNDREKYRV